LNQQQLRDLVAPVALYPDVVLSSLLPATTNPDQLHDAAQYVGAAQHVDAIPQDRGWDGSVIGLLQFPDVLRWLDQNPAWTDEMGQAVTYQQGDVLQAIQDYRHAVQNVGNLKSNQYQTVRGAASEDIRIEPARPDVVYVPSYDPVVATQPQPVQESPGINPWLAFGGGAVVGALGAWALYSIFDNDDNDHHYNNNYYGGARRIRGYNNYYYARGRRPAAVEWTPRPRARRAAAEGWQHPHRLDYHGQQAQPGKRTGAPLRAPMMTSTQQPPKPGEIRREQQQQRRELKQENRQEQQTQHQERAQQQREQRQERKQGQQQQKQMKQEQQGQRQEQRQEQRQQRQETQQEKRQQQQQNQQEKRQQQQQNQQEQRQQRQEHQQQQQEQRQEHQQERKEQRQEHQQQNQQNKNKKKNQQQQ
jgi:DNA segregation ATPase FtsK/SpoIIIE-like protein